MTSRSMAREPTFANSRVTTASTAPSALIAGPLPAATNEATRGFRFRFTLSASRAISSVISCGSITPPTGIAATLMPSGRTVTT